jgi:Flp pilus assembly protein TadB
MPAGERARRRAERERLVAAAEVERREAAERRARREARRQALTRWLPRSSGQTGALAVRRRQQTVLVAGLVVALNVLLWLGTSDWAARAFVALLSLLVTPIAVHLVTKK